jgi:tRNA threonylcarbamoyladenosine biosynthesis protein TsaE
MKNIKSPVCIPTQEAMADFASQVIEDIPKGTVIFLKGNLGAGKTTFVRGCLRGLGYTGVVNSPTYTLVNSYDLKTFTIHHFDLYRLKSPFELDVLGVDHYLHSESICFIEWPEKGGSILPQPKAVFFFTIEKQHRRVTIDLF